MAKYFYPKEIEEFIKVRCEQTPNYNQIARDVINKFSLNKSVDAVSKKVKQVKQVNKLHAKRANIKRLFFDIETSYYMLNVRAWQLKNFQNYFSYEDIIREKEIICISYKWQYEDKVHTFDWRMGERKMLKQFVNILGEADEIVAHNGDRFDLKFLRTRCVYHGVLMFPQYRTLDTLKKARGSFLFASNKLDYLGQFFKVGGKQEHEGMKMWIEIVENESEEYLEKMIKYCERDVTLLEDAYYIMSPFITHENNFAVLKGGDKWDCPECASKDVEMYRTYTTSMGVIRRNMKCNNCKKQYKISNKTYMQMLEYLMKAKNDQ